MTKHDFILEFKTPHSDASSYLDALYEAGCDDAMPCIGKDGYISLDFSRYAGTKEVAVSSAINDVQRAIPEVVLVNSY